MSRKRKEIFEAYKVIPSCEILLRKGDNWLNILYLAWLNRLSNDKLLLTRFIVDHIVRIILKGFANRQLA